MDSCEGVIDDKQEGDSLSYCPAPSMTSRAPRPPEASQDDESSALPPCGVDNSVEDSSSNASESPVKRRPTAKAMTWRGRAKKIRQAGGHTEHLLG